MAKRKVIKEQTMIYKTLQRKLTIQQHELETGCEFRCSGSVGSSWST